MTRCGGEVIDAVTYGGAAGFPIAQAASVARSGDDLMGAHDPMTTNWCLATDVYLNDPEHLGTPGAANSICRP